MAQSQSVAAAHLQQQPPAQSRPQLTVQTQPRPMVPTSPTPMTPVQPQVLSQRQPQQQVPTQGAQPQPQAYFAQGVVRHASAAQNPAAPSSHIISMPPHATGPHVAPALYVCYPLLPPGAPILPLLNPSLSSGAPKPEVVPQSYPKPQTQVPMPAQMPPPWAVPTLPPAAWCPTAAVGPYETSQASDATGPKVAPSRGAPSGWEVPAKGVPLNLRVRARDSSPAPAQYQTQQWMPYPQSSAQAKVQLYCPADGPPAAALAAGVPTGITRPYSSKSLHISHQRPAPGPDADPDHNPDSAPQSGAPLVQPPTPMPRQQARQYRRLHRIQMVAQFPSPGSQGQPAEQSEPRPSQVAGAAPDTGRVSGEGPQACPRLRPQAYTGGSRLLPRRWPGTGLRRPSTHLQGHILEAITVFRDKELTEEQALAKEEMLRSLDPEMLEEFLRAAEGMEAFCTPSQLRDMEFFTQSVRTQWEACFSAEAA
ncbi:hypothetical protein AALO_G00000730 [Alosa alosa]|uniref:Uncharacterized protein n=1 Tax=Alosa alosa TaxID=278164 RepID=A0AAV6HDK9_9TELE|nr:hypothetical protein AALO_G00000730 [Alosa alosa]